MISARQLIYSVRARHQGEVLAHCITRAAFLRYVVADARTRKLFERWRRESKLDLVVAEWSAQLDAQAARLTLPHRSAFHNNEATYGKIPPNWRAFFAQCEQLRQIRRDRTLAARAHQVDGFLCRVLYKRAPS